MTIDVQEVFNKVIDAGLYGSGFGCAFMCNSLGVAQAEGVITEAEHIFARGSITSYLRELSPRGSTLCEALAEFLGKPLENPGYEPSCRWAAEVGLPIYRNWADRPRRKS